MSDKQYDSVLVGYAEEPRYNDDGELMSLERPLQGQRTSGDGPEVRHQAQRRGTGWQPSMSLCSCPRTGSLAAVCSILTAQLPRRSVRPKQQLTQPRMPSHSDRAPIYFMTARVAFKKRKVVHERVVWMVSVSTTQTTSRTMT